MENNDDDRVRDHLANERTFLAWMRTGIATMGFGIVIAKLRYMFAAGALVTSSSGIIHASNIGLLFTIAGLVTTTLSTVHFFQVRQQIRQQRYISSATFILSFVGAVSALGLLILWYLISSR